MGYYVDMNVSGVRIPADKVADCLEAINDLHDVDLMKKQASGGSSRGEVWYSWVNNPGPEGFKSLADAFAEWRYESHELDDGSIELGCFTGQKWGDDEVLFDTIALFVEDDRDASIEVRGEDGEMWRYLFVKGVIRRQEAVIGWRDE